MIVCVQYWIHKTGDVKDGFIQFIPSGSLWLKKGDNNIDTIRGQMGGYNIAGECVAVWKIKK